MEALLEVSEVMVSSFEIDRNLRKVMRVLAERLGLNRGMVALVDPELQEIRIAAAHGLTASQLARGIYRPGEGIVGRVVQSGRAMVVPDIGAEPTFLNRTGARQGKDEVSFVAVPIKLRGEVLGVLAADRVFQEAGPLEEDVRVLEIVASITAHAIRLYWTYRREVESTEHLRRQLRARFSLPNMIGESEAMQDVFRMVNKVARSTATVLLNGESGTGKELIAHALHYQGARPKGPFVAVNCAALPENLLEAELFGYEKGAFTGAVSSKQGRFELARGGTIFLDEIGDLSLGLQAKLLRVLQERTFERLGGTKTLHTDARVISATNRDLEQMMHEGEYREDLYWRLNVVPIFLPALRDRRDDLPLLIEHFVERYARHAGCDLEIAADAMRYLIGYHWPGNIREMENTIQRLIVLAEGDRIEARDLPRHILMYDEPREPGDGLLTLEQEVELLERSRMVAALREHGYVQTKAAHTLGITPRQLGYKMAKYGIRHAT
ncbi:MAG: sigma 54-interacting transcriptional regulator [Coriobacteriia bacterium]